MRTLEIAALVLFVIAYFLGIVTLWVALFPELFFTEYLRRWDVVGSSASITIAFLSLVVYPLKNLGLQIYDVLTKRRYILPFLIALLCIQITGCVRFLFKFNDLRATSVTWSILDGNYAEADRELGSADYKADRIAYLHLLNSAISQGFSLTNQSADETLCRVYVNYFQQRNFFFAPAWDRYLGKHALASCATVLDSNETAISMYQDAGRLARWIGTDEERRAVRRMAAVYLRDREGTAGITDPEQRYRKVMELLGTDSHATAQRMRGSASYMLGEFATAAANWENLLHGLPEEKVIERKMLRNNIAMAHTALKQFMRALVEVEAGIRLPFNEDNQTERREQVRLLSTKALSLLASGDCSGAESSWELRNNLTRSPLGRCSSLISAQIHSCNGAANDPEQVLQDILVGTGQQPEEFRDRTEAALMTLADQAESVFGRCYLGLTFDGEPVKSAMRTLIADAQ